MRLLIGLSIALAGGAALFQLRPRSACQRTLAYGIEALDPRFTLKREAALDAAARAAALWDDAVGRRVFRYEPDAAFKIRFHFDERQESAVAAKEQRARIESGDRDLQELHGRYQSLRAAYDAEKAAFEAGVSAAKARGGATPVEAETLKADRERLRAMAEELNGMVAQLKPLASSLRSEVDDFNAKAGRAFDRGDFAGGRIDVYQFDDEKDLALLLTHEFGHALGVKHQEDPASIMYFARTDGNARELALADADKKGLEAACAERSVLDWRR